MNPSAKTFKELSDLVKGHHNPTQSVIVEQFKFNSRNRNAGESVCNYAAELRPLTMYCDYGDVLEDMLRDRLVCGINDERVKRTLLSKDRALTYKDALETAVALESARKNAKEIRSTSSSHGTSFNSSAVHHVKSVPTQRERIPTQHKRFSRPCFRCAGKHHSDDCRFWAGRRKTAFFGAGLSRLTLEMCRSHNIPGLHLNRLLTGHIIFSVRKRIFLALCTSFLICRTIILPHTSTTVRDTNII